MSFLWLLIASKGGANKVIIKIFASNLIIIAITIITMIIIIAIIIIIFIFLLL
jgi:hypothetical protein